MVAKWLQNTPRFLGADLVYTPAMADPAAVARQLLEHHRNASECEFYAAAHALEAGKLILEIRRELKGHHFSAWLRTQCPLDSRTARRYLNHARNVVEAASSRLVSNRPA